MDNYVTALNLQNGQILLESVTLRKIKNYFWMMLNTKNCSFYHLVFCEAFGSFYF